MTDNAALREQDDELLPEESELSEEEIERKMFEEEVANDPDLIEDAPPQTEPETTDSRFDEEEVEEAPEQQPEQQAQQEEPPRQPTGLEWLDEIPEEVRGKTKEFIGRQGQAIARLEQRVKSHLGQLQPAQRALSKVLNQKRELERKLAELEQQSTPFADQIANYDKWVDEEYGKDFPEEGEKLKRQFRDSLDGIAKRVQPERKPAPDIAPVNPAEEVQHLETAYSDWGERRFSPEFDQWFARQPREIQSLINSPYASDNVVLLDRFTADNPDWQPPQTPDQFHSLAQAIHSPLFRGWADAEKINLNMDVGKLPDYKRDEILTRFKSDLSAVYQEVQAERAKVQDTGNKVTRLEQRRQQQLKDRNPGSTRQGIKPGQTIDLDTEEGQRAYFEQLIAEDPDLR